MNIASLLRPAVILASCLALAGLGGCATVDQKIGLSYARPDHPLVRHSGDITVSHVFGARPAARNSSGEWIVGGLNNVHGVHQSDLLSDRSPEEWVSEAMLFELRQAGYTVAYKDALPAAGTRGIVFTDVSAFLNVNRGAVSTDIMQELTFNAEVFLNGDKAKTYTVASRDGRTVPLNASREDMEKIMLQSLQNAMQKILPEIIVLIDTK